MASKWAHNAMQALEASKAKKTVAAWRLDLRKPLKPTEPRTFFSDGVRFTEDEWKRRNG